MEKKGIADDTVIVLGTDHYPYGLEESEAWGNEVNYLVDENETTITYTMPFDPTVKEEQRKLLEDEDCGMQFSHNMEQQIGGQVKAGFLLTALYSDTNGEGRLHEMGIETYVATRAIKP